jgi:hypothetical protein
MLIGEVELEAALAHYRVHGYARLGKLMGPSAWTSCARAPTS